MLYLNGVQKEKLKNDEIISKVVALVEKKEKAVSYTHLTLPTTPYV